MSERYDLILKGATVVNHDGGGVRDIGVTAGLIAAIGDLTARIEATQACLSRAGRHLSA
jgi:dihydroorotase-like cyclic amidohydrolase